MQKYNKMILYIKIKVHLHSYVDKPLFYISPLVVISSITLLLVILSSILSNILINNLPYIAPNILFTIRNIIAISNPKIGTAEVKPPNVLNTVCH